LSLIYKIKIYVLAVLLGILIPLIDETIVYIVDHNQTLWYLITLTSRSEIIIRLITLLSFITIAFIISRQVKNKEKLANELRESNIELSGLFNYMITGFAYYEVLYDENNNIEDLRIVKINLAYEKLFNIKKENAVGKKMTELFKEYKINMINRPNDYSTYRDISLNCTHATFETYLEYLQKHIAISAYSIKKGYIAVIYEDINQRKLSENLLIESEKNLEKLNLTKDKFFSIISHDLRGTLGTVKEITKLLYDEYDTFDDMERKKFLQSIKNSSNKIYLLLENLLEWSRSQRGLIKVNPEKFNLFYITNNCIDLLKSTSENKKINLLNFVPTDLVIVADLVLLNTIIRNLITNAVKFTPEGGIIEIGAINKKSANNFTEIYVKDTGVGMTKKTIEKLFKIEENVTNNGTYGETGTGLGLILCKEFVDKHDGNIWVESETGKGSTFYFTLPALELSEN
jgi:signal transduction histidine kinase